jgi:iron complex outermembrane receptor protein
LLLLAATPLFAQAPVPTPPAELTLEQLLGTEVPIVVGASRFAQRVTDAPASISIVTREEIQRFGYRTLADILRGVRGFYVTYDRNYSYLGSRGLARPGDYNTRVLLLINGHRVNDNVYDSALIGSEFPIDPELMERVEVVRGPSSSLYGSNAFFAVVNVITLDAMDETGVRAATTVGSFGTARAAGTLGRLFDNGTQVLVAGSRYRSSGQTTIAYPGLGAVARDMDHDDAWKLFGTVSRGPWQAQFAHATRAKQIPTGAYFVSFDDPRSQTTDARGFVDVKFDGRVRGVSLLTRAYYDWYLYDGVYASAVDPLYQDASRGQWWGVESVVTRRRGAHLLTGGFEVRDNLQQDQSAYYANAPTVLVVDDQRSSRRWGAYVQDEFTISPHLIVNGGLRHDRYPSFGATTNPRVAVIYKPAQATALKLLYGTAFRAPNSFELYYYPTAVRLAPETIRTTEAVLERYGANGLRLAGTTFLYRVDGLISQRLTAAGDDYEYTNNGDVSVAGVEFEAERVWAGGWQASASATFQDATNAASKALLTNSPRQLGRVRVSGPLLTDRLTFGVEGLFTGSRLAVDGQRAAAFSLGNVTVRTARPVGGLTLSLHATNFLDRLYSDPGGEEQPVSLIPQDGRAVYLTASWRF